MYGAVNNSGSFTSKAEPLSETSRGGFNLSTNNLKPVSTSLNRGGKRIDLGNPNKCSIVGAHMINMNSQEPLTLEKETLNRSDLHFEKPKNAAQMSNIRLSYNKEPARQTKSSEKFGVLPPKAP